MIRYDSEYNKNIERVVSNFNRKIARLQRQGYDLLPSKVSVRSLKSQYSSRGDLNIRLRELQRFSKRGAEDIVTVDGKQFTAYDVDLFKRRLRRERQNVSRELAEARTMPSQYPMQHDIYTANLEAKRLTLSKAWSSLIGSYSEKLAEQTSRQYEIYDNYFEVLFVDAYQMGYDDSKIEYMKQQLLKLKPRQFLRALESDPNIKYIFEYYHSLTRQSQEDPNARDAFDKLYENIDAIVEKYS